MEISIDWWSGRVGNNLIQLKNAILFCMKYKIKFVQKLNHHLINTFSVDFSDGKFELTPDLIDKLYEIKGSPSVQGNNFYDEFDCPNLCKSFYEDEISAEQLKYIFDMYIIPNLKINVNIPNLDDNTLVIHIRSGDTIIADNGRPVDIDLPPDLEMYKNGSNKVLYYNPPMKAYENIISKFDKIILVAETHKHVNPVINALKEKYSNKITVQMGTLEEDILLMMSAKHLAYASIFNGTFVHMLTYLSKNLTNVYIFEFMNRDYIKEYNYINKKINIILISDYYENYRLNNLVSYNGDIINYYF